MVAQYYILAWLIAKIFLPQTAFFMASCIGLATRSLNSRVLNKVRDELAMEFNSSLKSDKTFIIHVYKSKIY